MSTPMTGRLAVFLLLFFLVPITARKSFGQPDEKSVQATILSLADEGVIRDLRFRTAGGIGSLDIYSRGFGLPLEYEGPREIEFFRITRASEEFEPEIDVVGRVRIPDGGSEIVLLFDREESEEESYRIVAIPNDRRSFPAGAFRFFNSSADPLYLVVDRKPNRLPPGTSLVVSAEGDDEGNFEIQVYRNPGANAEKVYSSVWHTRDTRRTFVFLSGTGSRVRDLSVRKIVAPIVPEKEGESE